MHEYFKAKFLPQAWEPVFAVTAEPKIGFATLYAVLGAFTGRSPIRIGLQAVGSGLATEFGRLMKMAR